MRPKLGRKSFFGVFGIDAEFHGVAAIIYLFCLYCSGRPLAMRICSCINVDAGNGFRYGVLNLQTGISFP